MAYTLEHKTTLKIDSGKYFPLGATPQSGGVNFALYSHSAAEVFLLLFDTPHGDPTDIIKLENRTRFVWHCFVHKVKPGQLYAYKVRGEYNPAWGRRFNENKLLLDPYAKAVSGKVRNVENLLLPYDANSAGADLVMDKRDNTHIMPKAVVVSDDFDWRGDEAREEIPLEKLIIYEVHLKGFTAHPSSAVRHPGTYLGLIEKIPYLQELGINAVELLPIHEYYVDDFLADKGLTNYWGYNTIGFFAPESSYGTGAGPGSQVTEFKTMVRELHRAGIEVILDVVYNHSGEGNERGPMISFKGIDNPTYYSLTGGPSDPYRYYMNWTGCGNSLNLSNTHVIRFVMDSLRYWVEVMHVDGFRFDLASVLGREEGFFQRSASFFDAIAQDPVLSRVKLIAEPWDLGTYQVGNFPVDWSEWNGHFRDTMRKFGKGEWGQMRDMGWRLTGSADLYGDDGRSAYNSVNFITCHDGFTLADLVSYNGKHNEGNREENRDGSNDNHSWNCGFEGETDDPSVVSLRKQLVKNYFCSLLFSAGTPMVLGGDEFMRTQKGNNNAYCQDNEISWFDWRLTQKHADILSFFKTTVALTRQYPVLQRRKFLLGGDLDADNVPDISWFGTDLSLPDWNNPELCTLCYRLDGGEDKSAAKDYSLFVILNADWRTQTVKLPQADGAKKWHRLIDTSLPAGEDFCDHGKEVPINPADAYLANPRSTVVLLGK